MRDVTCVRAFSEAKAPSPDTSSPKVITPTGNGLGFVLFPLFLTLK